MYNSQRRFFKNKHSSGNNKEVVEAIRALQNAAKKPEEELTQIITNRKNFSDFSLNSLLLKNIAYKRYLTPTPIQDQAIPHILAGRDLIGIANTGTGKTAAFLIPLIEKVLKNRSERILIMTPTRELALQISDELYGFSYGLKVSWSLCIGGTNIDGQMRNIKNNPNFVIGTPGRLKDISQRGMLHLYDFTSVVLDEADRMVDIGFIHDIKYFISQLPQNRQSLFFSATISNKVDEILKTFVKNPVTVSVKTKDSINNIQQELISVSHKNEKMAKLQQLLSTKGFDKVLIFGRTKWGVQKLANELNKKGFNTAAIHGNKKQNQRQKTLEEFKRNKIRILLATDVASRGLDIENVTHVINYDIPSSYEDYIHRIGRTGRADKKGVALTFIEP
jgi:superfamily II DNA/RNA helicase